LIQKLYHPGFEYNKLKAMLSAGKISNISNGNALVQ